MPSCHYIAGRSLTLPSHQRGVLAEAVNPEGISAGKKAMCQCNRSPRCRTHHRSKQAPDWQVEQLAPGVTRWILPSGRSHITTPTRYDT